MLGLVQVKRSLNYVTGNLIIRLSDIAGTGKIEVQDRDGAPVWRVTSKGNEARRGTDSKI